MKRAGRFVQNEMLWILTACVISYVLVYLPLVDNVRAVPRDRYYYGAEEYPLDMLGNLATVQLGYHGHILRIPKITTVFQGSGYLLKSEYILMGWIARVLGMDPLASYYLVRGAVSVLYLITIVFIIRKIFLRPHERVAATILVLFGAAITVPNVAWTPLDRMVFDALPLIRTTAAMTHYMLGGLSTMLSIHFLAQAIDRPNRITFYLMALGFALFSSFVYAPTMIVVILAFPLFFLCYSIAHRITLYRLKNLAMLFWMVGIYAGVVLLPMLYVRYLSVSTWDFTTHAILERLNPFTLTIQEYGLTVGIPYVLSWFALPSIIKKKHTFFMLLVGWLIVHPLVELGLSDAIGLNRIRMFLTPYFVVFGLLAAEGIRNIASVVLPRARSTLVLFSLLTVLVILSSYLSYGIVLRRSHVCFCNPPMFDYAYPKRELMEAVWWLRDNTNETQNVLSGYFAGTLIPAFAGNSVYTSWWFRLTNLPQVFTSWSRVVAFYQQAMGVQDARAFIDQNAISFVLFSDEERAIASRERLSYPFLREVVLRGNTILYEVE